MRTSARAAIESVNVWTSNDFARAGLAADEYEMAEAEAGLLEPVLESRKLVVTLQHSNHVGVIPCLPAIGIWLASADDGTRKMAAQVDG